jgi:HAE1 family hydrophobic/amphiphilic exporter-1
MLVGTVIGVLVIPGLYYLFGQLDGGRKLLKDETASPLSEAFDHNAEDAHAGERRHDRDSNGLPLPRETAESPASLLSAPLSRRPFPLQIRESEEEKSLPENP